MPGDRIIVVFFLLYLVIFSYDALFVRTRTVATLNTCQQEKKNIFPGSPQNSDVNKLVDDIG